MIIQMLFAVWDEKAEHYLPPFASTNEQTAKRQFREAASREGHEFERYSEDYTLFQIGVYDAKTGEISPEGPSIVCNASIFKALDETADLADALAEASPLTKTAIPQGGE